MHGGFSVKQILHNSIATAIHHHCDNECQTCTGKAVEEFVHLGTFESLTEALPTIHCDKNHDYSEILEACRCEKILVQEERISLMVTLYLLW